MKRQPDNLGSKPERVWTYEGNNVWTPERLAVKRYGEIAALLPAGRGNLRMVEHLAVLACGVVPELQPDRFIEMCIVERLPYLEKTLAWYQSRNQHDDLSDRTPAGGSTSSKPNGKVDRAKTSKEETTKRVMAAIAYKVQNLEWTESKCAREAGLPATTLNGHKLWQDWKLTIESAQRNGNMQKVKREFDKRLNEFVVVDVDSE